MNSVVCVICRNTNDVNYTNNRLVTESCGHVKCMQCLIQEKSGCIACAEEVKNKTNGVEAEGSLELEVANKAIQAELSDADEDLEEGTNWFEPDGSLEAELERQAELSDSNEEDTIGGEAEGSLEVDVANKSVQADLSDEEESAMKGAKKKPDTKHIKVEMVGKKKTYECLECKKKFHSRSMVSYHAYCNGQPKPYQCPIADCNKGFITLSYYHYHMRVHRDERAFPCDICDQSFFQRSKMLRHRQRHSMYKKYVCTKCDKGFSNSTALRRHGFTHTDERPYNCNVCNASFRDGSNFRKHVLKHQNNGVSSSSEAVKRESRPHQCTKCTQAFHSRKDLKRHLQIHTDAKPYRCTACDEETRFRRKDNLDRHIRNTHPDLVPALAASCDPVIPVHDNGSTEENAHKVTNEITENIRLEFLNPLPPLPIEITETHQTNTIDIIQIPVLNKTTDNIDNSYILEANHSRQSVIVDMSNDRNNPSPIPEYVHKIRKANSMRSHKDNNLPPIDPTKIIELEEKNTQNNLDIGIPLPKNIQAYKKILYDKLERNGTEEESKAYEMHWRRKMKLGINW